MSRFRIDRRPATALQSSPTTVEALLGAELAQRLTNSPARSLNIVYEGDGLFDRVEWERLMLADMPMAEHFSLGRQWLSDVDSPAAREAPADAKLVAMAVQGDTPRMDLSLSAVHVDTLDSDRARLALSKAHMIVLDDVPLTGLIRQVDTLRHDLLLVMSGTPPVDCLREALDAGAVLLCLPQPPDLAREAVAAVARELGRGASIGEATRWLHRSMTSDRFGARLYGDPDTRFVRPRAATSHRLVTSLSFDMVKSTKKVSSLGNENYAETLADFTSRCTAIVRRHGGLPDDPKGKDSAMCYFGHPIALEGAAIHAVDAGLAIARELGDKVRVGIATGFVAIDAGQPVDLSIHLAARLQQVTAPGTLMVSDSTQRFVAHAFELERVEKRPRMEGIEASEDIHRVIGPLRDAWDRRFERSPGLAPMVGREGELERLRRCWKSSVADGGRVVIVSADAGMGKSRLVREFRHELTRLDVKVLECRCRSEASESAFLPLGEALRRWLDIRPEDPAAVAMARLADASPDGTLSDEALQSFAAFLGIAPQPLAAAQGLSRARLLALLVDWIQAFARARPCCLIFDDWHWSDPSMREFLGHLVDRPGGPGLMVIVTVRRGLAMPPFGMRIDEHIELTGLPDASARQLVGHIFADTPMPPHLVEQIVARGDGVPLFLEESTREAVELGVDGTPGDRRSMDAVPEKLQDLLMARLDGLGDVKRLAQLAAVIGRSFSRDLLWALLESHDVSLGQFTLDSGLALLVDSGLVQPEGEGRYTFRHVLIRDEAYFSLWKRERQPLHAHVVRLLESRWPALVELHPELLALHQSSAGQTVEAIAQWEKAARHAAARSAEAEAISHLRHALDMLDREPDSQQRDRTALRLQLLLAARYLATRGYGADDVLRAYLEAQRLCDRTRDESARFKVEMGLQAYRFMRADFDSALEHGRRASAIAARTGDTRQRLNAIWGRACTLFHQGRLRATMREMELALKLYPPSNPSQFGVQDPGMMCMAYSSWGLWELGRPDAALSRIEDAVSRSHASGHRFSQAVTMAYAVSIEQLRGDFDAAFERSRTCLDLCSDAGFPVWLAITQCMRGYLLCERGEFETGLREMAEGHAQWLATGALVSQPLYLSMRIEGLMLVGRVADAAVHVDEGLALIDRFGERQLEPELVRLRGELALLRGDAAEGEAWLSRSHAMAMRRHKVGFALRSAHSLARHWASTGQHDRARRLMAPLAARWSEGHDTRDLRRAFELIQSLNPACKAEERRDDEVQEDLLPAFAAQDMAELKFGQRRPEPDVARLAE